MLACSLPFSVVEGKLALRNVGGQVTRGQTDGFRVARRGGGFGVVVCQSCSGSGNCALHRLTVLRLGGLRAVGGRRVLRVETLNVRLERSPTKKTMSALTRLQNA